MFLKGEEGLGFVWWFVIGHENGSKGSCFLWSKEAGTEADVSIPLSGSTWKALSKRTVISTLLHLLSLPKKE